MTMSEKKNPTFFQKPPVSEMVESIVGCKWSLRVLQLIRNGVKRPGEMQRQTPGLSAKVLNERLSKLQRFGIAEKEIFPVTPPHVEYRFTSFGEKFLGIVDSIQDLQRELLEREE